MAERRKSMPGPTGELVEGVAVQVAESTEQFSDVSLADGTILRIKPIVTEALRLDEWDQDGYPTYIIKSTTIISIVDSPDELMKKSH